MIHTVSAPVVFPGFRIIAVMLLALSFLATPAWAQISTGSSTMNTSGTGTRPNSQVEMNITDFEGVTTAYTAQSNNSGAFTFAPNVVENTSLFTMGFTLPYSGFVGNGSGNISLNIRYDEGEDVVTITATTMSRATMTYRIPGDTTDRVATTTNGRFNLSMSAENAFVPYGTGDFVFSIANTDNMNNNNYQTVTLTASFAEIYQQPPGPDGSNGSSIPIAGAAAGTLAALVDATWGDSLKAMTDQMVSATLAQMKELSTVYDASFQMETESKLQEQEANAKITMKPDPHMCEVASRKKGRDTADNNAKMVKHAVGQTFAANSGAKAGSVAAMGEYARTQTRFNEIVEQGYCDPASNGKSGMGEVCTVAATDKYNVDTDLSNKMRDDTWQDFNLGMDTTSGPATQGTMAALNNFQHRKYTTYDSTIFENPEGMAAYQQKLALEPAYSLTADVLASRAAEKAATFAPEDTQRMKQTLIDKGVPPEAAEASVGTGASLDLNRKLSSQGPVYDNEGATDAHVGASQIAQQTMAITQEEIEQDFETLQMLHERERLLAGILAAQIQEKEREVTKNINATIR